MITNRSTDIGLAIKHIREILEFVQFGTFDFKNGNIVKEISTRLETEVKFQLSNLLKTKSPLLPCEALDEPCATRMNHALQGC